MRRFRALLTISMMLMLAAAGARAHADAALLMEEPYGLFGGINPTGHAAIYLNHVCADTPTHLRPCRAGELGIVISRYHRVAGYDWLAIPLVPYLYAVDRVEDVPATADETLVADLRDAYRRKHLARIVPDVATGEDAGQAPKGDWTQLVGASYDRKIYGFEIETTREEDERFIAEYNDKRNESHFNLFFRNCADFSRTLLNLYYPHAIHRNYFVDFGITTPKQVARSLTKYAKRHPELKFSTFVVPQVSGSIDRSHHTDGVLEAMLKSKKYVVPLAVLNPQLTAGMIVAYLANGRFTPPKDATTELVPGTIVSMSAEQGDAMDGATPFSEPVQSSVTEEEPGTPPPSPTLHSSAHAASGAAE